MHESTTYQYILDEGRIDEARKILLRLGRQSLGKLDEATTALVNGIADLERLEQLLDRLSSVSTWRELLHTP